MTLTKNEHSRYIANSFVLRKEKWVDSLLKRRSQPFNQANRWIKVRWDWSVIGTRFAFRYVYDSRNTRICRSALTAIFWQRAVRRAIRTKRVTALGAKPAGFRCSFHILAQSRHRREDIALQVRCSSTFNRPDWRDDIARKFFVRSLVILVNFYMFGFTSFPRGACTIR